MSRTRLVLDKAIEERILTRCPLCEATDIREIYVTSDRHYGIPGLHRVVKCASCSLIFLNPLYSDEKLASFYPDDYYAYQERADNSPHKEILKSWLGYRTGTKDPSFARPGTMLDLGCGSGWFLEKMRARGWIAQGVEINKPAARLGRARGLDIFCGTLQEAKFPSEHFDYVRSNHSFEHMSCPHETLDEIYRILKPHGKLLVGVPNTKSVSAVLFAEHWWYLTVPVHVFNYSVENLSRLLTNHNFRVEEVNFNSDYHGLIGSLQIWLNRGGQKKSAEGLVFNNHLLRLVCQWSANVIDLWGRGDCVELTAGRAPESSVKGRTCVAQTLTKSEAGVLGADTGVKIGAVSVTYNSAQVIDGFMASMLRQTHANFALYIVDNASSDQTLERLAQYKDPRISVIRNERNVGIAEANNQGTYAALASDCEAVLFVNNDTEFEPFLLEKLAAGMQEHTSDMIAPKILFHDGQQVIWSAGGGFSPFKGYAGYHYGLGQIDRGQFDVTRRVDHAPACCLLVRKDVFAKIGFMDSRYFVYHDDTDFCYRAKRAGLKLIYLPAAKLLHKASSLTGGPESDFSVRYRTRNQIYFMLKHLGLWRGFLYLPAFQARLLLRLISRKIDIPGFLLREKAFAEGWNLWRHSAA